jgi:hypothetical protein
MGRAWSFTWRWIGNLLRVKALWELLPAGAAAVLIGYGTWVTHQPIWLVVVLSLGVGIAILVILNVFFRKDKPLPSPAALPSQHTETHASDSPATAFGSIGDIGAGAHVVIGGGNKITESSTIKKVAPSTEPPKLICLRAETIKCRLPEYSELHNYMLFTPFDSVCCAIRNDAITSAGDASDVVAHLEFESATHGSRSVDEGWWREDADLTTGSTFWISRSETKFLVITVFAEDICCAVSKNWTRQYGRTMPTFIGPFGDGPWRLTIELSANGVKELFYCTGTVNKGSCKWSVPSPMRPVEWNDAPR